MRGGCRLFAYERDEELIDEVFGYSIGGFELYSCCEDVFGMLRSQFTTFYGILQALNNPESIVSCKFGFFTRSKCHAKECFRLATQEIIDGSLMRIVSSHSTSTIYEDHAREERGDDLLWRGTCDDDEEVCRHIFEYIEE